MFLMYVDESGDTGTGPGASDFFVLSGLVVHEAFWDDTVRSMTCMRHDLAKRRGLGLSFELHATRMVGRANKSVHGLSRTEAILLYKDVLRYESLQANLRLINVVVDKRGRDGEDIFDIAWRSMFNAFDDSLSNGTLPSPFESDAYRDKGFLIVDQTNKEKLRALLGTMRSENCRNGHRQLSIIEDPMHKNSEQSLPIQLSDANAYFLLQLIAPNGTVKRHKAKNYFYLLEPILLKEANPANPLGIIYA